MREHKYRVWDAETETMFYEDDVCSHFDIWNLGTNKKDFPNNKLMEYTGKEDRRKEKLWEGDRTRWLVNNLSEGVVKHGDYTTMTGHRYYGWYVDCEEFVLSLIDSSDFECIGNIYETPA